MIDPFFTDNPACDHDGTGVEADFVLLTHGHGDHVGDAIRLVERTGATVISSYEICTYFGNRGHDVSPHSIGGGVDYPFGRVKMTPAVHGGMVELPDAEGFTTAPGGFLVDLSPGQRFHHAGDTGLTMDMQFLKGLVDVAVLPIGDRFTMGPEDAVRAVELIEPDVVIPCHYNTWPLVAQDPEAFKAAVGDRADVRIMTCGDTLDF